MKCPFCAEDDLRDEAIVCKHCGRDLAVYQSFATRIAALEQRVSELSESPTSLRAGWDDATVEPQHRTKLAERTRLTLAVVVASVATAFLLFPLLTTTLRVLELFGLSRDTPLAVPIALSLAPSALGLWIGLRFPLLPRWHYLVIGAAYGTIFTVALSLHDRWSYIGGVEHPVLLVILGGFDRQDLGYLFLTSILGVFAGSLIVGVIRGTNIGAGLAERLAGRVVSRHAQGRSQIQQEDRVKRLAAILSAIGPLLTFAAALISAYLGFLAKK